jgi:hypothetical protein
MQEVGLLRNLRKVSLASLRDYGNLMLSQFEDFPPGLEELSLVATNIKVRMTCSFWGNSLYKPEFDGGMEESSSFLLFFRFQLNTDIET